jgi:hypothetical protein
LTTKAFAVTNLDELLALHRVFREAKFCAEPDDTEVSDSPIVAELFERLMDAVVTAEVGQEGETARQRWEMWLALDESRDEWAAAIMRAKRESAWRDFSDAERRKYVAILLSPFRLSSELMERFISLVDEAVR